MGQATHIAAYMDKKRPWAAKMEYNALGQETKRLLNGGICSSFAYDLVGRPVLHEVSVQKVCGNNTDEHNASVQTANSDFMRSPTAFYGHTAGYLEKKRRRRYVWDVNYRLKKVTNELTKTTSMYSYDELGNLVSAKESDFGTLFRITDSVGNLYETQDNTDRIYGAGSRLEKSGIDLKEKRNQFQGGYGKLVTKLQKGMDNKQHSCQANQYIY